MEVFLDAQCKSFVESCILGLIFGAGYDIIRILYIVLGIQSYTDGSIRNFRLGGLPFLLFLAGDLVYMLTVTFAFSVFLYHANYGQFRLYLAAACVAGFVIYHHTLGRIVMRISETLVCWLKRFVYTVIIVPIRWLLRWIRKVCVFLWRIGPGSAVVFIRYLWLRRRTNKSMQNLADIVKL